VSARQPVPLPREEGPSREFMSLVEAGLEDVDAADLLDGAEADGLHLPTYSSVAALAVKGGKSPRQADRMARSACRR
jgi:hypothetical protein